MRECKIIHINDGRPQETANGNFYFSEIYPRTETELQTYLDQGYEVKHMVPMVAPAIQKEGAYGFYLSGFAFYLEREAPEGERSKEELPEPEEQIDEDSFIDPEDWDFDDMDGEEED